MPTKQCSFRISKEEFLALPPGDQSALIYSCLFDIQDKVDWKWKKVMAIGAVTGLAGGFLHDFLGKFFGVNHL